MAETTLRVALLRVSPDPEELVAMAARLCYSGADIQKLERGVQRKDQTAFLNQLMSMGHHSTAEHAVFTFGIEGVSRTLLAQITRHRIASFSVQSQRYVGQSRGEDGFAYVVPPSIQGLGGDAVERYHEQMRQIDGWYKQWADELGAAGREDARFILPGACETKMMMTMNVRELWHFFSLRCCNRAQWEIRALAFEMLRLCKQAAPVLFAKAGPGCVFGACPEGAYTCGKAAQVRADYRRDFNAETGQAPEGEGDTHGI